MSKIRILAIPPDVHGTGKFRIISPYAYIQENYPDAIKTAMIKNPIPVPDISLNDGLDIVNKARQLMERDGTIPVKHPSKSNTLSESRQVPTRQSTNQQIQTESRQEMSNDIITIIESTIRKILDEKLTQILNAQQAVAINENLVIRVGDSLFSGKITKIKSSK